MNYLNLSESKTENTAKALNVLLADYHLYYQKLRNFHWNIVGENFFDLHAKFEEMYDDAKLKIDEIAERMLTLRFQPESNISNYLELSNLSEASSDLEDFKMLETLLVDHENIIIQMRKVVEAAEQNKDEGTVDLVGEYIRELEKSSWMLNAWIIKHQEKEYS